MHPLTTSSLGRQGAPRTERRRIQVTVRGGWKSARSIAVPIARMQVRCTIEYLTDSRRAGRIKVLVEPLRCGLTRHTSLAAHRERSLKSRRDAAATSSSKPSSARTLDRVTRISVARLPLSLPVSSLLIRRKPVVHLNCGEGKGGERGRCIFCPAQCVQSFSRLLNSYDSPLPMAHMVLSLHFLLKPIRFS